MEEVFFNGTQTKSKQSGALKYNGLIEPIFALCITCQQKD